MTDATCTFGPHRAMQRTWDSGHLQIQQEMVKEKQLSQVYYISLFYHNMSRDLIPNYRDIEEFYVYQSFISYIWTLFKRVRYSLLVDTCTIISFILYQIELVSISLDATIQHDFRL